MVCSQTYDREKEYIHMCTAHPAEASAFYERKLSNIITLQYGLLRERCTDAKLETDKLPIMQMKTIGNALVVTLSGNWTTFLHWLDSDSFAFLDPTADDSSSSSSDTSDGDEETNQGISTNETGNESKPMRTAEKAIAATDADFAEQLVCLLDTRINHQLQKFLSTDGSHKRDGVHLGDASIPLKRIKRDPDGQ